MRKEIKKFLKKINPRIRRFMNILIGVTLFVILIGSALSISLIFGAAFILGFTLSIYNEDLKKKPWKPIAIFIGALLIRIALNQFVEPVLSARTIADLVVSAMIFVSILVFGWKIKRS